MHQAEQERLFDTEGCPAGTAVAAVGALGSQPAAAQGSHQDMEQQSQRAASGRRHATANIVAASILAAIAVFSFSILIKRSSQSQIVAQPDGSVRLAVVSDTHVAGPEYGVGGENGPLDNASVTRTQQRLFRVVQALNAVTPAPQLTVFGGDIVHNGLERLRAFGLNSSGLRHLFAEAVNGYSIAAGVLSHLRTPKLFAWGNHDHLVQCGQPDASAPPQLSVRLLRHYFKSELYGSVKLGRHWKVIALNSMLGYTWNPADARCNGVLSSYGEEQLRWLDQQLADGRHAVIVAHFPLPTAVLNEVPQQDRWRDIRTVLTAHTNVRLVLSGHSHKGVDWQGLYSFAARTMPSTRYNHQNFFLLDLHPNGTFEFPDELKNRGGSRCSDWWSYQSAPHRVAEWEPKDAGDCGVPPHGQEAAFALDPVRNASAIPPQDWFNPERSCQFVLAKQFLEACAGGASQDCCDVVADQWRLSSSAPFSACFCQPSFWQESVQYMQDEHGVDLPATLQRCISSFGKLVAHRGGPLTWCPAAASSAAARPSP